MLFLKEVMDSLYPVTNQCRIAISLNGLWNFSFVPLVDKNRSVCLLVITIFLQCVKKEIMSVSLPIKKIIALPQTDHDTYRIRIGAAGNRVRCYVDGHEVYLYVLPQNPINDITIETHQHTVSYHTDTTSLNVHVSIKDPLGKIVAISSLKTMICFGISIKATSIPWALKLIMMPMKKHLASEMLTSKDLACMRII